MKRSLSLLIATSALTATVGLPALAGMHGPSGWLSALQDSVKAPLVLVSGSDDDDDDDHRHRARGDDDDDHKYRARHDDDDDDDDCDDDDDDCRGAMNPAPAGSSAPPQNGLFNNGAAPKVQVNGSVAQIA